MAVFYNKQKGIHGSLTGTIISFPVEVDTENPAASVSTNKLPAGYLRCDGRVLTSEDYPLLAVVLGTGDSSKFRKSSQALSIDQFQLPDLRSKHIRATTSSNIGTFNDFTVTNAAGNEEVKSGVQLDVLMNVDSPFTLTYNGSFYIPPQSQALRGEPSFAVETGSYTFNAEVPDEAFQPHMHRTTTLRSRQVDASGNHFGIRQVNSVRTKTTLNVCKWWEYARQDLCYWYYTDQITSGDFGQDDEPTSYEIQYGHCWNSCNNFVSQGYCLWPDSVTCPNVPIGTWNTRAANNGCNDGHAQTEGTTWGSVNYPLTWTHTCVCPPIFGICWGGTNGVTPLDEVKTTVGAGLPTDLLGDINLPFAPLDDSYQTGYAAVSNNHKLTGEWGNDATHRHRLDFNSDVSHTFVMNIRASTARADSGLVSKISLAVNNAPKADKYIQPYVVTEYFIKI
mgnify:CR=1 FL=1